MREIDDHNWHCFESVIPSDGRFILVEGTTHKGRPFVFETLNSYEEEQATCSGQCHASQKPTNVDSGWTQSGTLLVLETAHREDQHG